MELRLDHSSAAGRSESELKQLDAAVRRVDSFLRSYRLHHAWARHRLVDEVIRESEQQAGFSASDWPLFAMKTAHLRVDQWLAEISGILQISDDTPRQHLAVLAASLSQVAERYPEHFLQRGPIPDEVIEAIRAVRFQARPELKRKAMGTPGLEFGAIAAFTEAGGRLFVRWPWARGALFWSAVLGASLGLFILAR